MKLTPEMEAWLATNKEDYEFYLLHKMLHDRGERINMLQVAHLTSQDFSSDAHAAVLQAMDNVTKIENRTNQTWPSPLTEELLRTHILVAVGSLDLDPQAAERARQLVRAMQDVSYSAQWVCIPQYLAAWLTTVRAKLTARRIQMKPVVDTGEIVAQMTLAQEQASRAIYRPEDDEMVRLYSDTSEVMMKRLSTGIQPLDECLNGGLGKKECYMVFSGTGGGKSIATGQVHWHLAEVEKAKSLIVSTELYARDYLVRTVANSANIKIYHIQDCENVHQIKMIVWNNPELRSKMERVEEVLDIFQKRIRVIKVDAEQGLRAGDLLQREYNKFGDLHGEAPGLVSFDWIGTVADASMPQGRGDSDRISSWERSANSCVSFADRNDVPTMILAQATNDSEQLSHLVRSNLAIAKGMMNNMTAGIGITNQIDAAAIKADAANNDPDRPSLKRYLEGQKFCLVKARKGEGRNIPVKRDFLYQRFTAPRR